MVGKKITNGQIESALNKLLDGGQYLVMGFEKDGTTTRHARFPRALCRFETADGRSGVGWTEWNQPAT